MYHHASYRWSYRFAPIQRGHVRLAMVLTSVPISRLCVSPGVIGITVVWVGLIVLMTGPRIYYYRVGGAR
jgi:hypothetical protein